MKQIEITVRSKEEYEESVNKVIDLGFKKIRDGLVNDIYMTQHIKELTKDNIQEILKSSVLLRYNIKHNIDNNNNEEFKKITYKCKTYDENNLVLSEEKISVNCDDLVTAKKLFEALEFTELVRVKYNYDVYAKDNIELAFQNVEGIGTLIEYENTNDFDGKSIEEIKTEKEKMYDEIKNLGLNITDEYDAKKAYELIEKNVINKNF